MLGWADSVVKEPDLRGFARNVYPPQSLVREVGHFDALIL